MLLGYLFYTSEGYTVSPVGEDMENLQILGIEYGRCAEEATKQLLKNNPWILNSGFDPAVIQNQTVINTKQVEAIRTVTEYLWQEEGKKYDDMNCIENDSLSEDSEDRYAAKVFEGLKLLYNN